MKEITQKTESIIFYYVIGKQKVVNELWRRIGYSDYFMCFQKACERDTIKPEMCSRIESGKRVFIENPYIVDKDELNYLIRNESESNVEII